MHILVASQHPATSQPGHGVFACLLPRSSGARRRPDLLRKIIDIAVSLCLTPRPCTPCRPCHSHLSLTMQSMSSMRFCTWIHFVFAIHQSSSSRQMAAGHQSADQAHRDAGGESACCQEDEGQKSAEAWSILNQRDAGESARPLRGEVPAHSHLMFGV